MAGLMITRKLNDKPILIYEIKKMSPIIITLIGLKNNTAFLKFQTKRNININRAELTGKIIDGFQQRRLSHENVKKFIHEIELFGEEETAESLRQEAYWAYHQNLI